MLPTLASLREREQAMPRPKSKSRYDVHPGVAMMRKWADELPVLTGHTLDQWARFINNSGIDERNERIAFLKDEHGIGTISAWHIVDYAADKHSWDGDPDVYLARAEQYVEAQYSGPKASLRPIFETVLTAARKLGNDVRICPCKTIVPLYRERVFAELKPATRTRVELSFALACIPFGGLLKKNPRANDKDRLKHQVHLAGVNDVTPDVLKWLKLAYDQDV
jgi:hypothetical protein